MQDGTFDGHCSYLVEDIVESIPVSGENQWWEEVKTPQKGPDTPAAHARANATVESSASDGPRRHYRRGSSSSSSGAQRPLMTEEEELLSDCAMQAWEYLQDRPAVQNRVIKAFQKAGARVKVENGAIIKEESHAQDAQNDF